MAIGRSGSTEASGGIDAVNCARESLVDAWRALCDHEMTTGGLSRGRLAFERAVGQDVVRMPVSFWTSHLDLLAGRKQGHLLLSMTRRAAREHKDSLELLRRAIEAADEAAAGLAIKDVIPAVGLQGPGCPRTLQCGAPKGSDPAGDAEVLDAAREVVSAYGASHGSAPYRCLLPLALAVLLPAHPIAVLG